MLVFGAKMCLIFKNLSVDFKQLIIVIILFKSILQRENNLTMPRNHNNEYLIGYYNVYI